MESAWYEYLFSLITLHVVVATAAGVHVLLYKRNSRAALGWLGLVIVFPLAGPLLYALFGINRVRRKALRIAGDGPPGAAEPALRVFPPRGTAFGRPGLAVTGKAPSPGNRVRTFHDGEQAYPAMLGEIGRARREVLLSTYIFDNDDTGLRFIGALQAARDRGCSIAVLVDDVGIRYSFPTIIRELKRARLPYRRFMPLRLIPPSLSINLRTHRKLLIVDRSVAFTGGMNIGDRQLIEGPSPHRASDLHFSFQGPLVKSLAELFADDWKFARGDELQDWPLPAPVGDVPCRLIRDGPDDSLDSLMLVIMGVVGAARERVWIMSPYFLPDRQMLGCLQAAALAGVDVRVVIPEKNNWPLVQWALQHNMDEMLSAGIHILMRPPPFAHSKCILVDQDYALVGTGNMDQRSLRLNFELGVEVFDADFNLALADHFAEVAQHCIPYTTERLAARSTLARIRDGASALFSPYL